MEVLSKNSFSILLPFFEYDVPLVIDGFTDLKISKQLQTLNINNLSSDTKRNQMIEALSQTLPDMQGKANTFKRIRLKSMLSAYYGSYSEIQTTPIHQWTPAQVAFSFFIYLLQKQSSSTYAWQFAHNMIMLCEDEQLNGIVLYELIKKENQNHDQNNLMQLTDHDAMKCMIERHEKRKSERHMDSDF
eukprot:1129974_1